MQQPGQEDGGTVVSNKNATALQICGSESPQSPHEELLECPHEGRVSRSGEKEPPSEPSTGGVRREDLVVHPCDPPSLSREAYCLMRDAARAGFGVPPKPYPCSDCTKTFGREKKMQGHKRWEHRPRNASSEEEAPTPKKARKKRKTKRATMKVDPCHEEPPLPFSMVQGATSRGGQSSIHAAGEDLADPTMSPVTEIRCRGTQVRVGGRDDLVSLHTHQVGHVSGAHNDGHVNQAMIPTADNPEVTISESTVTAQNNIAIEVDGSDNDNAMNVPGSDPAGNPNPVIAVRFGPTASSAPHEAPVQPMARARAAVTKVVVSDESSDDENVVNGKNAAAVLPLPRTPAAPTAADMLKGKKALHEGRARYGNGGHGKAVAGYSNAGHSKAASGYSSGGYGNGYGYGKAIAIGGHSKRDPCKPYSCEHCGERFYTPQALGGHVNRHRSKEKKVHYGGLVVGPASNTSSSSTPPCPPANAVEPSEMTAMNSNAAAVRGTANTVHHRPCFPASGGVVLALPAQNPVQRMAMASNPAVPGSVSAATAATGTWSWSLPATSSSFLPAIPLQDHGGNPHEEIAVVPGNRAGRTIRAFSSQEQEENPPQVNGTANSLHHGSFFPAPGSAILALPAQNPVQRMAMTSNPAVPGLVSAATAATGSWSCSLAATTSSFVPAIPLPNHGENPPEEIVVPPGNRAGRTIRSFSSQDQEENPPQEVYGTANAVHHRSLFPVSAGSAILALPALNPVQRMAVTSNPVPGLVPAATAAYGSWSLPAAATGSWSLRATTSSFLPSIPLQNQWENAPEGIEVAFGNRAGHLIHNFSDTFPAFSSQEQEANPPQAVTMAPGNGEHHSIRLFGSDTSPQLPLQNQVNPLEGVAVAPGYGEQRPIRLFGINASPALPSQNQEQNPPHETVPGNRGPPTIILFGINLAEDPKEPKK